MKRFLDGVLKINIGMQTIAAIFLSFIILMTTVDVVVRIFGKPIPGAVEIIAICAGVVLGFTVPISFWMKSHISVDFVLNWLPTGAKNLLNIITRCVGIGLCLLISWNFMKIATGFWKGQKFPGLLNFPCIPLHMPWASASSRFQFPSSAISSRSTEDLMNEVTVGCIALGAILFLFLTGLELPFCMILVGVAGFTYLVNFKAATHMMVKDIYDVFVSYGYTVFPLFIFMGQLAFASGIAKKLYDCAYRFLGHIPGGLAMATVGGATAFKALCGSANATAATFSGVAIPEMDRYHYSKTLSTGLVAVVGTLGCLIPPSVFLIIYGLVTEQSIGRLFLAGIIPGTGIALLFMLTIYGWAKINRSLAPAGEKSTWKQRIASLPEVVVVVRLLVMIVGF